MNRCKRPFGWRIEWGASFIRPDGLSPERLMVLLVEQKGVERIASYPLWILHQLSDIRRANALVEMGIMFDRWFPIDVHCPPLREGGGALGSNPVMLLPHHRFSRVAISSLGPLSNSVEYTVIVLVGDYFAGQPCDLNHGEAFFMHTSLTEITVDGIN